MKVGVDPKLAFFDNDAEGLNFIIGSENSYNCAIFALDVCLGGAHR